MSGIDGTADTKGAGQYAEVNGINLYYETYRVEIFNLLDRGLRDGGWMGEGRPKGGHALAILPGLTHYNIFHSPLFAAATLTFLGEQST
jgi:hypothetical protein